MLRKQSQKDKSLRRFLKVLSEGDVTTFMGREFQSLITGGRKTFKKTIIQYCVLQISPSFHSVRYMLMRAREKAFCVILFLLQLNFVLTTLLVLCFMYDEVACF